MVGAGTVITFKKKLDISMDEENRWQVLDSQELPYAASLFSYVPYRQAADRDERRILRETFSCSGTLLLLLLLLLLTMLLQMMMMMRRRRMMTMMMVMMVMSYDS